VELPCDSPSLNARLTLACTANGVAQYYPSLDVNGTITNIVRDVAQAGDTVEFAVSQSSSKDTISVIDLTHKFMATSYGSGSGTGSGIIVGDFPGLSGSTTIGVPNFGTLTFSSALVNGLALGFPPASGSSGLQANDLSTSSTGPLRITTVHFGSNRETFAVQGRAGPYGGPAGAAPGLLLQGFGSLARAGRGARHPAPPLGQGDEPAGDHQTVVTPLFGFAGLWRFGMFGSRGKLGNWRPGIFGKGMVGNGIAAPVPAKSFVAPLSVISIVPVG